jgi:hypothetical protein
MDNLFNMKMKLSKASWMILGAGIFIIILAGLGVTRSGQITQYDDLSQNLSVNSARLNNLQTGQMQTEIDEYQEQLQDTLEQVNEVKDKLKQTVISVDVADKFYEIAAFCNVTVMNLSTTTISDLLYASINCETIAVSGQVRGTSEEIVNFIIALNDNFTTGFIKAAQIAFTEEEQSTVSLQMGVYTQKVSK